ncbi:MAG TPA: methyltransferase [Syntrophales bacterium]|nr:methyltransferase [Syntrophales bacterium]
MTLKAENILELARNFMESRILLTGAELDLFTRLGRSPATAAQLAGENGLDLRSLTILLDALSAIGLLVKDKENYRCDPGLIPFLSKDSPESLLPMILHASHLWKRWDKLTDIVKGIPIPAEGKLSTRSPEAMRAFIGAMHVVAAHRADSIVRQVRPGRAGSLIDVGGGPGTYTIAFLRAAAHMTATLFDRPEVIEMARERIAAAGLEDRVRFISGDFLKDELPAGHDLAFVSAIIHQNSRKRNRELYGNVYRSLIPGGRIVIRDYVMDADRIRPRDGAVFAVNMLAMTQGGNSYTYEEIEEDLVGAGFEKIRLRKKGDHMDALVEALKKRDVMAV